MKKQFKGIYFVIGMAMGLLLYLLMYGVERIIFTNVNWINNIGGDILQHYYGWQFYRDGDWQMPLGLTDGMSYPSSISMLYTDSIPLLAIFFKLFRNILPETFQYLGLYGLLCFLLQGGMGSLITSKFTSSKLVCALSSVLFVVSPVMLFRMYAHTALAGHFLILMALYLWLCCDELEWKKAILYWGGLGVLCGGIHMYFIPMLGIILVGFCLKKFIEKKYTFLQCVGQVISYCAGALITIWIEGGFYGNFESSAGGLGHYNANLNTLYNGMGKSVFMPNLSYGTDGQYEGWGYLGIGVILLFIIGFVAYLIKKNSLKARETKNKKALVISTAWLLVVSVVMAISINVCFNQYELFTIKLPEVIEKLLGIFRSSGRFIWITVYVIEIYAVKLAVTYLKDKFIIVVIAVCSILQIVDLQSYFLNHKLAEKELTYTSDTWDYLADNYSRIIVMGDIDTAVKFNLAGYAARNHMKISTFQFARTIDDTISLNIEESKNALLSGNKDESAVYIFNNTIYDDAYGLYLYNLNGLMVGIAEELEFAENVNVATDEILIGNSEYLTNGEDTNNGRILHKNGISYGPYLTITEGQYCVTVEGENLWELYFDVYSQSGDEILPIEDSLIENDKIQYKFRLDKSYTDLELRFSNSSDMDKCIKHIYLTRIE